MQRLPEKVQLHFKPQNSFETSFRLEAISVRDLSEKVQTVCALEIAQKDSLQRDAVQLLYLQNELL